MLQAQADHSRTPSRSPAPDARPLKFFIQLELPVHLESTSSCRGIISDASTLLEPLCFSNIASTHLPKTRLREFVSFHEQTLPASTIRNSSRYLLPPQTELSVLSLPLALPMEFGRPGGLAAAFHLSDLYAFIVSAPAWPKCSSSIRALSPPRLLLVISRRSLPLSLEYSTYLWRTCSGLSMTFAT